MKNFINLRISKKQIEKFGIQIEKLYNTTIYISGIGSKSIRRSNTRDTVDFIKNYFSQNITDYKNDDIDSFIEYFEKDDKERYYWSLGTHNFASVEIKHSFYGVRE